MKLIYKLKAMRAAVHNIWFEQYFVFDPGTPSPDNEFELSTEDVKE